MELPEIAENPPQPATEAIARDDVDAASDTVALPPDDPDHPRNLGGGA